MRLLEPVAGVHNPVARPCTIWRYVRQQSYRASALVLRHPVIEPVLVVGIPVEFILFALTLLGVACCIVTYCRLP